jgi:hypothetical protein
MNLPPKASSSFLIRYPFCRSTPSPRQSDRPIPSVSTTAEYSSWADSTYPETAMVSPHHGVPHQSLAATLKSSIHVTSLTHSEIMSAENDSMRAESKQRNYYLYCRARNLHRGWINIGRTGNRSAGKGYRFRTASAKLTRLYRPSAALAPSGPEHHIGGINDKQNTRCNHIQHDYQLQLGICNAICRSHRQDVAAQVCNYNGARINQTPSH